jgi:hypothetical protein
MFASPSRLRSRNRRRQGCSCFDTNTTEGAKKEEGGSGADGRVSE